MLSMLMRRSALGLITVWLVSIIIFIGVEILPGDACTAFLEREAQGLLLENCRRDLGLDRPAWMRYGEWAANALSGNLGVSPDGQRQISELVGYRLRNTLLLASGAILCGIPLALFLGIVAALWRDRPFDIIVSTTAIAAMTIPEFVSATLLILIFSVWQTARASGAC